MKKCSMKEGIVIYLLCLICFSSCNSDDESVEGSGSDSDTEVLLDAYNARIPFPKNPFIRFVKTGTVIGGNERENTIVLLVNDEDEENKFDENSKNEFIEVKYNDDGKIIGRKNRILGRAAQGQKFPIPFFDNKYRDSLVYENNLIKVYGISESDNNRTVELMSLIRLSQKGQILEKETITEPGFLNNFLLGDVLYEVFRDGIYVSKYNYNNKDQLEKIIIRTKKNTEESIPDHIDIFFEYDEFGNLKKKTVSNNKYLDLRFTALETNGLQYSIHPFSKDIVEIKYSNYDNENNHFKSFLIFDELIDLSVSKNNFSKIESIRYSCIDNLEESLIDDVTNFKCDKEDPSGTFNSSSKFKYEERDGVLKAFLENNTK